MVKSVRSSIYPLNVKLVTVNITQCGIALFHTNALNPGTLISNGIILDLVALNVYM